MRKLIRPSLTVDPASTPGTRARKPPPPESTHAEAAYLRRATHARAIFTVALLGGEELSGRLLAYDRECLKVQLSKDEPPTLLRKAHVKWYRAERAKPRESSAKPRESSAKPRESSAKPRESSAKPRESSAKPRRRD